MTAGEERSAAQVHDEVWALEISVEGILALDAERDRYREALERIYQTGKGIHVEIAREVLNRG